MIKTELSESSLSSPCVEQSTQFSNTTSSIEHTPQKHQTRNVELTPQKDQTSTINVTSVKQSPQQSKVTSICVEQSPHQFSITNNFTLPLNLISSIEQTLHYNQLQNSFITTPANPAIPLRRSINLNTTDNLARAPFASTQKLAETLSRS